MTGKGAKGLSGKGAKGTMGDKKPEIKKKRIFRSARAGLQFPVGRVHRLLKVCLRCHALAIANGNNQIFTPFYSLQARVTASGRVGSRSYSSSVLSCDFWCVPTSSTAQASLKK